MQWKSREQQKAVENELAAREEFENELESVKASLEQARDELKRLEEDDSMDLETKLARQQVFRWKYYDSRKDNLTAHVKPGLQYFNKG